MFGEKLLKIGERRETDTLKSEHLKAGASPIIACVDDSEQCDIFGKVHMPDVPDEVYDDSLNIDYGANTYEMEKENIANSGQGTYLISPIDERNKLSLEYRNCTGLAAVGTSRESGKNISFLTHQYPQEFLQDSRRAFVRDLSERLKLLKELSEEGSIDVVIYGGNYFTRDDGYGEYDAAGRSIVEYAKDYKKSINLLSEIIKEQFGFRPVVITGPNRISNNQNVFFDTEHRQLHVVRPRSKKNFETNESYHATKNALKLNEKKWREK